MAQLAGIVLGSPEPRELAVFYEALLDYERFDDEPGWVRSGPRDASRPSLGFQLEEAYVAPTWPPLDGSQQMMVHLDLGVPDLEAGVIEAIGLGARTAAVQPQDDVRVMIDPHGHPFCLFALG